MSICSSFLHSSQSITRAYTSFGHSSFIRARTVCFIPSCTVRTFRFKNPSNVYSHRHAPVLFAASAPRLESRVSDFSRRLFRRSPSPFGFPCLSRASSIELLPHRCIAARGNRGQTVNDRYIRVYENGKRASLSGRRRRFYSNARDDPLSTDDSPRRSITDTFHVPRRENN